MAEALLRSYAGEHFEVLSAGLAPTQVHPLTCAVLTEIGLDPQELYAKSLELFLAKVPITYAIIVCEQGEDACPSLYPFAFQTLYWPFDDPTQAQGSTAERLRTFRQVRDQIDHRIRAWLNTCEGSPSCSPSLHDTGGAETATLLVHGGPGAVSRPGVPLRLPWRAARLPQAGAAHPARCGIRPDERRPKRLMHILCLIQSGWQRQSRAFLKADCSLCLHCTPPLSPPPASAAPMYCGHRDT
jgi:arsenate reductase